MRDIFLKLDEIEEFHYFEQLIALKAWIFKLVNTEPRVHMPEIFSMRNGDILLEWKNRKEEKIIVTFDRWGNFIYEAVDKYNWLSSVEVDTIDEIISIIERLYE